MNGNLKRDQCKFVTSLPINFDVLILKQYMSEMRLRHKKPINSYVGQANYDSNEAQDVDFANKNNLMKKTRLTRQRPINDQTKKYAEILCQFVNAVNLDYRNHITKIPIHKLMPTQEPPHSKQIQRLQGQKQIKDENYVKTLEVVSKQQQKIRKSENIINRQTTQTRRNRKQRPQLQQIPKNKQIREPQPKVAPNTTPELKNLPNPYPMQPSNYQKQKPTQIPNTNINYTSQIPTMTNMQQFQQVNQIQQMFQNSLYGMNPALYSMYQYAYNPLFNYQFYLEQMKSNQYMTQNFMGMLSANMGNMSNASTMNNNCIPFSKLPFQRNPQPEPMKQQAQPQRADPATQPKVQTQPQIRSVIPQQQQSRNNFSALTNMQPLDFKKKSCFHVATAYNIYYARLKQKGLLSNMSIDEGFDRLERLDPTFPAKRIRQRRRNGEGITNQ